MLSAELSAKRSLLVSLLQLTNGKECEIKDLREQLKMTTDLYQHIISEIQKDELIDIIGDKISINLEQRLKLAMKAIESGAPIDNVARNLGWLEFEELTAKVFEENGFAVKRRFRFQALERRWEIDVLATRRPYILCGEAKHWCRGMGNSTARGIIEEHINKSRVFSNCLPGLSTKIGVENWRSAIVMPLTLTLSATPFNIYRRVPSVSVVSLPGFLSDFDGQIDRFETFTVDIPAKMKEPMQLKLRRGGLPTKSKRHRCR